MTTKPPSQVEQFPADSAEQIAYSCVSTIPTEEPNDRNRLGYHVWRWLKSGEGTIAGAIAESGARLSITQAEALTIIRRELEKKGISVR
jgi:hypothetical protein